MTRWVSPPVGDGRYCNGWWPRIVWPYVIYGNGTNDVLDLRTLQPVAIATLDGATWNALLISRSLAIPTIWIATARGVPWTWTRVEAGSNEQSFAFGRPSDDLQNDRGCVVELPGLDLQTWFDELTDTWVVVGQAMGNHGTPDYRDGELHVITGVPSEPRRTIAECLTPFTFPIRLPDAVTADVWTFGDDVTGTVGGGLKTDRPNRQGIGLWSKADALKYGAMGAVEDAPWLDLAKPLLGVWISPHDAVQGLRAYPEETRFLKLIAAYQCDHIKADLLGLYRQQRDAGRWDMGEIEERIAIEVCRATGCSLTLYDDHALMEVPGSEGTRYRPETLEHAFGLQKQQIGVVMSIRTYPDGQAGWAFEDCARAIAAGPAVFTDRSGRPKTGFDWLQLTDPAYRPMEVIFNLGRYTQAGAWSSIGAARRLEEMVRIGQYAGVLCFDVFGVGRGGESPEWQAWANGWLSALLAKVGPCDVARWPRTVRPRVIDPVITGIAPQPTLKTTAQSYAVQGRDLDTIETVLLSNGRFEITRTAPTEIVGNVTFFNAGLTQIVAYGTGHPTANFFFTVRSAVVPTPPKKAFDWTAFWKKLFGRR